MLAENIAARISHNGGCAQSNIELINNSTEPFDFIPSEYICESKRIVQRLAIGGIRKADLSLNKNFI